MLIRHLVDGFSDKIKLYCTNNKNMISGINVSHKNTLSMLLHNRLLFVLHIGGAMVQRHNEIRYAFLSHPFHNGEQTSITAISKVFPLHSDNPLMVMPFTFYTILSARLSVNNQFRHLKIILMLSFSRT